MSGVINTECDSQQTTSANYSVGSTASTTLASDKSSFLSTLRMSVFACCDTSNYSLKAKEGTPSSSRDMSMKTMDVMMSPVVVEQQCQTYSYEPNSCRSIDDYVSVQSIQPTLVTSHAIASDCANVARASQVVIRDHEIVDIPLATQSKNAQSQGSSDIVLDDIDLICSIADTYDLGEDSDTFSFISNFLYNNHGLGSILSAPKGSRFSAVSLDNTTTTLSSDQLYPDSMSKQPMKSKYVRHHHKQKKSTVRVKSSLCTNQGGNPLIL